MADAQEQKVYDQKFAPNQNQNTRSADDLDAQIANDAARQLSGEELVDDTIYKIDRKTEEPEVTEDTESDALAEDTTEEQEPEVKEDRDDETTKRIARLAAEARIAKRQLKAAQEENARLRGNAPALPQDAEIERQINERATALQAQKAYNDGCNKIFQDGVKLYPDFEQKVGDINKELGSMPVAFVEAAMEIGDPHKIIHYLGSNLDEAERILALPPHKMGAALAKVAQKTNAAPAPKPVSKAPAPIKPVAGSPKSSSSNDPDKMSMDEFVKWQDAQDKKRRYG